MLQRTRKKQEDENTVAAQIVVLATGQPPREKNPAAVALGHLGGLKGGKARAEKLTPKRRRAIAQKAAKTRWERKKNQ